MVRRRLQAAAAVVVVLLLVMVAAVSPVPVPLRGGAEVQKAPPSSPAGGARGTRPIIVTLLVMIIPCRPGRAGGRAP